MKKDIIITGNIGSGKSTVTKIFKEHGYEIISADVISSQILEDNCKKISDLFCITYTNLSNLKRKLGQIIFQDTEKKKILEDFMIPKIYKKIETISSEYKDKNIPFVMELPTFFETRGLRRYEEFFIINVLVDEDIRFNRIQERNKELTEKEIRSRMSNQISPEAKVEYSSTTIENNSGQEELKKKIQTLIKQFKKEL